MKSTYCQRLPADKIPVGSLQKDGSWLNDSHHCQQIMWRKMRVQRESMEIAQIQLHFALIQLHFALIKLHIHYVIKPQAGHKETKNSSRNKPYCHNITHDDDDDDIIPITYQTLYSLKKKQFGKCLHCLTSWWVHSVIIYVYKSWLFPYTGVLISP